MIKKTMKILTLLLLIAAVCGCTKQDTVMNSVGKKDLQGSDELWYWNMDDTSCVKGDMFYTVSINGDKLVMYNLSTNEKEYWPMEKGTAIQKIASLDADRFNAILYHEEKQIYEIVQLNIKTKEIEKVAEVYGPGLLDDESAYWLDNCQLKKMNIEDKTTEVIADFNEIESNSERIWPYLMSDNYLVLYRTVIASNTSNLFVVNIENSTWEYIEVDAHKFFNDLGSNTSLKGMNEEGLYFWACSSAENLHFKTDFQGENPKLILTYPNFQNASTNTPVSENGIYYSVSSRQEGVELERPAMLLMNWKDGAKKIIGKLDAADEVRSYVVDGFIKSVTFRTDGTQIIYLTNPKTGLQWTIDEEKLTYYQERENAALDGIDHLIEIFNETSGKSVNADQAGSLIATKGKQVVLNDYLYCISENYDEFYRIHMDTLEKEILSFPEMKKSNFYLVSSLEVSEGDLFVHYDCFVQNMRNSALVQLDGKTLEQKFQIQEFSTASVNDGKLYYVKKEENQKIYVLDLKTYQEEVAGSLDEMIRMSGIFQDAEGGLWTGAGSRWIDSLYRINESKKVIPALHADQLGTWNEDSMSLIQTENGLLMAYMNYADFTVSNSYYRLSKDKVELLTDRVYGEEETILTENGIFYAVCDDFDPSVPKQKWGEDYDPYMNVYFADYAGNLKKLCRLEGTDATLHYFEKQNLLLIEESDYQTNEEHTYQLDLRTLQLREVE